MARPKKPVLYLLLFSGIILFFILLMQPASVYRFRDDIAILFPKGIIGYEERSLLFMIQALMLLVIVPVYLLTFIFSWRYRASNPKATYDPDLVDNKLAEIIWWGLPTVITVIISVLIYVKTEELDPFKAIPSEEKEITIQAVALQWKWLFIYPEEKVASLNFLQIPTKRSLRFEVTADAPMNSLWIPQLGGQIYAMPKMTTVLYLRADETGDFRGSSANISGEGFADMHFIARASSEEEYQQWLAAARQTGRALDLQAYEQLAKPGNSQPALYRLEDQKLFDHILHKYSHQEAMADVR